MPTRTDRINDVAARFDSAASQWDNNPGRVATAKAVAVAIREDGSFHSDATGVYHHGFDRTDICAWLERAGFTNATSCDAYRIDRDGRKYGVFLATARG